MKFTIITLFPDIFDQFIKTSIIGRAVSNNILEICLINLRDFGIGSRQQVDDTPYGGGSGMVMRVDVVAEALNYAKSQTQNKKSVVLLMTPQGHRLKQQKLRDLAEFNGDYIMICGHYEGFDERIRSLVDQEVSIGDFVLTGGELGAMVLIDGIARLMPGVLGNDNSSIDESHSQEGRLEYPQYTRPEVWQNLSVPKILLSGNHGEILKWRQQESNNKSNKYPDLN